MTFSGMSSIGTITLMTATGTTHTHITTILSSMIRGITIHGTLIRGITAPDTITTTAIMPVLSITVQYMCHLQPAGHRPLHRTVAQMAVGTAD